MRVEGACYTYLYNITTDGIQVKMQELKDSGKPKDYANH